MRTVTYSKPGSAGSSSAPSREVPTNGAGRPEGGFEAALALVSGADDTRSGKQD